MIEISLADTAPDLARVSAELAHADLVAIDTEFVRERTYYPELCLIQVATTRLVACIDCLALLGLDEFIGALIDSRGTWVLHSARQDLEVVWNRAGRFPATVIDTQIAAALTGLPPQASLQTMLENTLGVTIEKDQTRAEWNRRPLADAALRYALEDVRFLLPAWQVLEGRLMSLGRLDWLHEECRRLLETSPTPSTAAIFERTKGSGALQPAEKAAAIALIEWRESRARTLDRPRRWVLSDEQLLRLARGRPRNQHALESVPDLPARLVRRNGTEILAALARANSGLTESFAVPAADERPDKTRLKATQDVIRSRADELGIAPEFLATRRDATAMACGRPPEHIRNGWRGKVLGDLL